jgi:hypothetical protein
MGRREGAPVFWKHEPIAAGLLLPREHGVHGRQIRVRQRFDAAEPHRDLVGRPKARTVALVNGHRVSRSAARR